MLMLKDFFLDQYVACFFTYLYSVHVSRTDWSKISANVSQCIFSRRMCQTPIGTKQNILSVKDELTELRTGNKLMHLPGLAVRGGQSVRGGQQERAQDRGREEEDDS